MQQLSAFPSAGSRGERIALSYMEMLKHHEELSCPAISRSLWDYLFQLERAFNETVPLLGLPEGAQHFEVGKCGKRLRHQPPEYNLYVAEGIVRKRRCQNAAQALRVMGLPEASVQAQ